MALRHRHGGPAAGVHVADDTPVADDDVRADEEDEEVHASAVRSKAHASNRNLDAEPPASCPPGQGQSLTEYVGAFQGFISQLQLEDVYRYWSKLQDWLGQVPAIALQTAQANLPPSVTNLYFGAKGPPLTPEQQQALEDFIVAEVAVPYMHDEHWDMLIQLWELSFPGTEVRPEQHDAQWKRLGFQGMDAATDFRSAGLLSLKVLLHFAQNYPDRYHEVMMRTQGKTAEESYPFACAAINITFMLTDIAKLRRPGEPPSQDPEAPGPRATFARLLEHGKLEAFLDVAVTCLLALDSEWVRQNGTYMRFPFIIKAVRERAAAALKNPSVTTADMFGRQIGVDLYKSDVTD